jgi:plasmid stability protein
MPHEPVPPGSVGLRLEIPAPVRDVIRVAAAKAGKSMAAYLRDLVTEHAKELESRQSKPKKGKQG